MNGIQYEDRNNVENIDAITDKMVLNNHFLAELLTSTSNIKEVLKKNGFFLTGKASEIFEESVNKLRKEMLDIVHMV